MYNLGQTYLNKESTTTLVSYQDGTPLEVERGPLTLYKENRLARAPKLKVEPSHLLNVVVVFIVVIFSGTLVHTEGKIFDKIIEMKKKLIAI